MKKKGLSPVIATVLLIALALILAIIIFLWARNFISDQITKEGREITQSCSGVNFQAEAVKSLGNLSIVNRGNIPLYGIEIRKKSAIGSLQEVQVEPFSGHPSLLSGETRDVPLPSELNAGMEILVIPVLLGESVSTHQKRPYPCDKAYGKTITVKATITD
jgi:flagellin-like protein